MMIAEAQRYDDIDVLAERALECTSSNGGSQLSSALTFSGSGNTPSPDTICPRYLSWLCAHVHLGSWQNRLCWCKDVNTAGALQSPIGITHHWYKPNGVENAVYALLSGSNASW